VQIQRYGYGIRGFGRLSNYGLRFMVMVSDKAQYRYEVLRFWERYGLAPTLEAFKVKRRTLYHWRGQLRIDGGDLEALNEKSRAPRLKRKRLWPKEVTEEIRRLRTLYPNLSKEKLYPAMKLFCEQRKLSCPKARTIGRIIADQPDKMRSRPIKVRSNGQRIERKKRPKGRKPKGYKASAPGQCGAFDTVEYFLDGIRRYVITFTDHYSRFAFAWATHSHASLAAREFFAIVTDVFPYPLQSVLTDNGSEFMKHFDEEIRRLHKTHWHTYPRTPKMNAHVERFNRTIQEEFIDYHQELLITPNEFNRQLIPWLIWYNAERPHWSLELKSPVQFLLKENPSLCKTWWPNTSH
jgi:transposase InsO family protein